MKQRGRIRSAGWAARTCCAWGLLALLAGPGFAELLLQRATLTRDSAEQLAPRGDESDWIYGDIVLRNDHLVAVVARPVAGRNANWVLREVGCSVIDFTHSQRPEEALGIFRPGGPGIVYRAAATQPIDFALGEAGGDFRCVSEQRGAQPVDAVVRRFDTVHGGHLPREETHVGRQRVGARRPRVEEHHGLARECVQVGRRGAPVAVRADAVRAAGPRI